MPLEIIIGYVIGSLTMLIGVITGFVIGNPALTKRLSIAQTKPASKVEPTVQTGVV